MMPERIQINQIQGAQKIYCFPFEITISNITQACPNYTTILEGHAPFKIASITHVG